ncbi:hypothetical protein J32TS2_09380 [Shouchella clausii]|uniref:WXG100 family type VII secretion target n=1 Tax=Shouchella clausii TaxID=79880 RepID=UPI001B066EE2|nr:WXG100 family type VII secretion target [Shouchella clausii]GIN15582.1 hypothetical protein J32TS2_09380 [Shouchella clausii]
MSLEIKVDPAAVQSLIEKARLIPGERMEEAISKLDALIDTVSDWKGDAKAEHDLASADLRKALVQTQALMEAMLATLDQAIEQMNETDEEMSSKFETKVDHYLADQ